MNTKYFLLSKYENNFMKTIKYKTFIITQYYKIIGSEDNSDIKIQLKVNLICFFDIKISWFILISLHIFSQLLAINHIIYLYFY